MGGLGPVYREIIDGLNNEPISRMVGEWFKNPGIPVIHIILNEYHDTVELIQVN